MEQEQTEKTAQTKTSPPLGVLLNLSDSEWVLLIDGNSEDSELPICCANVSDLRDVVINILRNGRNRVMNPSDADELKKCLKWVADGHVLSPLLKRICDQIGFDPSTEEHKGNRHEV